MQPQKTLKSGPLRQKYRRNTPTIPGGVEAATENGAIKNGATG